MNHGINTRRRRENLFVVKRITLTAFFFLLLSVNAWAQTPAPPGHTTLNQVNLTLAWDPNTESDLAGYKVYIGSGSSTYGTPTILGLTNTITLFGFANGTYYFVVTAFNKSGLESGYSNEVSATIISPGPAPGIVPAIQGPFLADLTATTVKLAWKTITPSTARIEFTYGGGSFSSLTVDSVAVMDHYVRLTDLHSGTTYTYEVFSTNSQGSMDKAAGSFRTK